MGAAVGMTPHRGAFGPLLGHLPRCACLLCKGEGGGTLPYLPLPVVAENRAGVWAWVWALHRAKHRAWVWGSAPGLGMGERCRP